MSPTIEAFNAIITVIYSPFLRGQAAGAETYTIGGNTFKTQHQPGIEHRVRRFTDETVTGRGFPTSMVRQAPAGVREHLDGANDASTLPGRRTTAPWIADPANIKPLSRPAPGDPDIDETFKVVPTAVKELAADTYTALKIDRRTR